MGSEGKPYRCMRCGRRFSHPTGHTCKGGFRKRHLLFDCDEPIGDAPVAPYSVACIVGGEDMISASDARKRIGRLLATDGGAYSRAYNKGVLDSLAALDFKNELS